MRIMRPSVSNDSIKLELDQLTVRLRSSSCDSEVDSIIFRVREIKKLLKSKITRAKAKKLGLRLIVND